MSEQNPTALYSETPEIDTEIDSISEHAQSSVLKSEKTKRGSVDLPLLLLILILLAFGVIMVLSASFAKQYYSGNNGASVFIRQISFAAIGILVMFAFSRLTTRTFRRWSTTVLLLSIAMLVMVLVIGIVGGGSRRWIDLKITTFQPSEIAKLGVILAFADIMCRTEKKKMKTFRYGVLPFGLTTVIIVVLLALEPHYSAAMIIIGIAVIMMIAGGTDWKWFAIAIIAVAAVVFIAYNTMDYIKDRLSAWQHPESDPLDTGFQVLQSLYAVGSGGLTGLGLGQSRQKYLYLPESHNDYIFAIVCEELGFIGAVIVLVLFALLIIRCFWIALHAKTKYDALVVIGIAGLLSIQVFLNVAVVTNLLPSTGISLPFFSYGGTALVIQMLEMGIVLSISRDIPMEEEKQEDAE